MPPQNPNSQIPPALRHRSLNRRQLNSPSGFNSIPEPPGPGPKKPGKLRWLDHRQKWRSLRTRHKLIVIVLALVVIAAGGLIARSLLSGSPEATIDINKTEKKVLTIASPLTGVQVSPDLALRPITGIMIENSQDARPQSGIQDAGVVFEAIAEGGITRFMTLYQEAQPQYIGPVRSLRPYYIDWAAAFDASVAHVGGSPDALSQIRNGGKDLDQFFNAASYWRQNSRPSPHNVYTSFEKLDELNKSKSYTASKFDSWPRKAEQKPVTPAVKGIDLNISSANFNVHYDYDSATNSYLRFQGGAPHLATVSADNTVSTQINPKVVVALVMSYAIIDRSGHSGYSVNGSGTMYVFQDGGITQGTWAKASRNGQFVFTDSNGQALALNSGRVWVSVIQAGQLNYTP